MDETLDIFGRQPGLNRLYTQLCLCFRLEDDSANTTEHIIDKCATGLKRLSASFPWLAGQMVYDKSENTYKIQHLGKSPGFVVQDLRDSLPSIDEYQDAGFPGSLLDENIVAPSKTFRDDLNKPAPVLLLQATFIKNGVLLVINGLHSCMDMAGQGQVIYLFSKACSNEPFTEEEISSGNLPRQHIIPLLEDDERHPDSVQAEIDTAPAKKSEDTGPPLATWSYFVFSGEALSELKACAMRGVTSGFVSTDDALSAFVWQGVSRARLHRISTAAGVNSTFTRTVDTRRHIGIPPSYMGNAAVKTSCVMDITKLANEPLGTIASQLRASLADVGFKIREQATLLSEGKKEQKVPLDPSTGLNLSSWAKERCYNLDFGEALGKPVAVRRPSFEAWESLVYLMPKKQDGEIAVAICLRDQDTERLKYDSEFKAYGKYVG